MIDKMNKILIISVVEATRDQFETIQDCFADNQYGFDKNEIDEVLKSEFPEEFI